MRGAAALDFFSLSRDDDTGVCRCQRVLPAGYDVDRESGGLRGRTGVLGWWGKYLTCSVWSVPLMAAEDLPSSQQFWVVCGGFIPPGVASTHFWQCSRTRKSAPHATASPKPRACPYKWQ